MQQQKIEVNLKAGCEKRESGAKEETSPLPKNPQKKIQEEKYKRQQ